MQRLQPTVTDVHNFHSKCLGLPAENMLSKASHQKIMCSWHTHHLKTTISQTFPFIECLHSDSVRLHTRGTLWVYTVIVIQDSN